MTIEIHNIEKLNDTDYLITCGKKMQKIKFRDIGGYIPSRRGDYAISKKGLIASLPRKVFVEKRSYTKYRRGGMILKASLRALKAGQNSIKLGSDCSSFNIKEAVSKLWG